MTSEFKRKLDLARNASIDLVALNNKVVSMRPIVKRSKVHVVNKITTKIKKLRGKKGTEKQKRQNASKASNLVEEIKVIKVLKPDYISKYALGATDSFEKLICQPNLDMERRALARLAEHHFIQEFVKKFRAEHSDWKDLTAYLMTKHTSREFKKKKPNQKLTKVATNVKATERIVETYLGDKLKNRGEEIGSEHSENAKQNSDSDEIESNNQSISGLTGGHSVRTRKEKNDSDDNGSDDDSKSDDSESDNESEEDNYNEASKQDDAYNNNGVDSDANTETDIKFIGRHKSAKYQSCSGDTSSSESDFDDVPVRLKKTEKDAKHKAAQSSVKMTTKKAKGEKLKKTVNRKNKNEETGKSFAEKTSGEMIVKKINLEELAEDTIDSRSSHKVPEFLLETALPKTKRKTRDPFFCASDDEENDSNNDNLDIDEDDNIVENDGYNENDNRFSSDINKDEFTGIRGLSTTFVGSLHSNKMMKCDDPQYRSNEEWKKIRQEMKFKKVSERGRGGFHSLRGRGQQSQRGRGGNMQGSRGRGQFRGDREDSRGHRGGFRHRGRGQHGQRGSFLSSRGGHESSTSEHAQTSVESKTNPEEKLLRPSWLTQGSAAVGKKTSEQEGKHSEEKLHPSWLASKKRKEQQTSIPAFQGKRIKFD